MSTENKKAIYLPLDKRSAESADFTCSISKTKKIGKGLHYHDFYQIIFVRQGRVNNYVNNHVMRLTRGECFVVTPYTSHSVELDQEVSYYYGCSFKKEFLGEATTKLGVVDKFFKTLSPEKISRKICLTNKEAALMEGYLAIACEEYNKNSPEMEVVCRSAVTSIIILLARALDRDADKVNENDSIISCLDYIAENYSKQINTKTMVERLYISEATFFRTFKHITGYSFKRYLTLVRMRHAKDFLRDKNLPLAEVAANCGYMNYSVFFRAFIQEFGISPSEYRDKLK